MDPKDWKTLYNKLEKHGSVYEVASFIREYYDGMPDHQLEPLLFRLLAQLLPEPTE